MAGRDDRRGARWIVLTDLDPAAMRRTSASRFGWRLLAANNRPLGRAVTLATSLDECVRLARQVHESADVLEVAMTARGGGTSWVWQAHLGGEPLAVCVHPFVRRVECARAFAQFTATAARTQPHAEHVRHYGAQALRGYADITADTTPDTTPDTTADASADGGSRRGLP